MSNQDKNKVIILESKRRKLSRQGQNNLQVDQYSGQEWSERLSFTVGLSYAIFGGIGFLKGLVKGFPKDFNVPKKLILNNFLNSVGKESSRFGNAAGGISLMYYLIGSGLNIFFEDELEYVSPLQKNILCGAITGGLYKSTLGVIPTCVGGILGGFSIGVFSVIISQLNKKGITQYEMKF